MTMRETVMRAVRREPTDRVPFTCYRGLLPAGAADIPGMALVASAPAFRAVPPEGVENMVRQVGDGVRETTMHTPWGTLTQVAHTETGYGSAWTREHWVKRPEDYAILEQVVRNTRIEPDHRLFADADAQMGDRGVIMAWMNRVPFQRLWIEYVGMERLALDLVDCPEAVEGVLDALMEQSRAILAATAASSAQLVWVPDNITGEMTGPPYFRKYLAPYYAEVCEVLGRAGKIGCCHMDGMLRQIADCIGETALPVLEAFTPPPDGNFTVAEARAAWPEKVLWLNFPSSVHLREPVEVQRVARELVAQAGDGRGFLVGVTENIPTQVGDRSLRAIAEVLA
jgi:hypothetical protein